MAWTGDSETKLAHIEVIVQPIPVSDFSGIPLSGVKPLTVSFTDLSTNSPTSWLWNFGDGYTSTEQNPVHNYLNIGIYSVSLKVTNAYGEDTEIKNNYIEVINQMEIRFINFVPAPQQTNVSKTTAVSFSINDAYGNVNINTLNVRFGNIDVISNGLFVNGYLGGISHLEDKYNIGIYPKRPKYFNLGAEIKVHIDVTSLTLDAYDYSFFIVGYKPVPPPEPLAPVPTTSCNLGKPFFPPKEEGLSLAKDDGTGTNAILKWVSAAPYNMNNMVLYNVYYSTNRDDLLDKSPDWLVTALTTSIGNLTPGDENFFYVNAAEYNPLFFTYNGMEKINEDTYNYPVPSNISTKVTEASDRILVDSVFGFPTFGIIKADSELIIYSSLQVSPPAFIIAARGRGYNGTLAENHDVGAIVSLYKGEEDRNKRIGQVTTTFQKPNYAVTYVLGDGYGPDGYRDGYDGYDNIENVDGYLRYKQEYGDALNEDGTVNDSVGDFKRFDYCGSWRTTAPRNFMQGQCQPSYFGGARVIVDKDGNRHLVKNNNVYEQMMQREEMLLESTGEAVVILRRMWSGLRCMCYMNRQEHPNNRCPICYGTSFVQGYIQFFNQRRSDRKILLRIDPATDDLNLVDKGGFEPMHEPDGWTLAFPQIKNADIIIRYDINGNEIFRYEVLNVTRNKVLFSQTGVQKMKLKRLPKTSIIYQFPIVVNLAPYPGMLFTSINGTAGIPDHSHGIIVPQNANISAYNGATLEAEKHNHIIYSGNVNSALNHSHILTE